MTLGYASPDKPGRPQLVDATLTQSLLVGVYEGNFDRGVDLNETKHCLGSD